MRSNCCARAGRCTANSTSSRRARPGRPSPRVIAFGAHDGQLPGALTPSPDFAGGPLRLVPFVLGGDADVVARVGDAFERELMERGMAGAGTALAAQELFGLQVEHARYLTVHDLAALMAMQYEHAGLAAAVAGDRGGAARARTRGMAGRAAGAAGALRRRRGADRVVVAGGMARAPCGRAEDSDSRASWSAAFEHFQARQRQFAAVLGAHGITVTFVHCPGDADARSALD